MSLNIVFAGTPLFSAHILKALINTPHTILGVYTQPDRKQGRGQKLSPSPVKVLAIEQNIPVYQPPSLKPSLAHEQLKSLNPDLMVVVAYGLILPPEILAIPRYGCINIHPSNLPRWRGAAPIQRAILSGDTETGVCIMQMDAGMDTGDVLLNTKTPISPKDTSETLENRLANMGAIALIQALERLEQGTLEPEKQDDSLTCYAAKITKEEARIDWSQSAHVLDCKIRGFNPWPIAYTEFNNQLIRIFLAEPVPASFGTVPSTAPGTILEANPSGVTVMTGAGVLRLLELQLPGGKRLSVRDLLNSKKALFQPGVQFHS